MDTERKIEVPELPIEVRASLEQIASSLEYDGDALSGLTNDFIIWAEDIEKGRPSEDCHLLEIRSQHYHELTTPAQFRAAADYLKLLVEQHAPERTARKQTAAQECPHYNVFTDDQASRVVIQEALITGRIGKLLIEQ